MALRLGGIATPVVLAFAVSTLASAVSCGGGKGPAPAGGQPDGGASGGTSGGGPDGGSGGGGTGSGGTTSGGSPDGGGSPGNAACSGLTPTPDAGHVLRFDTGSHASCWRATSNPEGQLSLGIIGGAFSAEVTFHLYPPDGSTEQGSIAGLEQNSRSDIDPWFHWTSSGYAGLVHEPPPPVALRSFDGTGAVVGTTSDDAVSSAPDAHGGTVMLGRSFDANATPPSLGPTKLEWVDSSGNVLRTATLDGDPTMLLVDWGTDHVLALLPGSGGLRARWYDGNGNPLTRWFDAGAAIDPAQASMHLLLDGTIALSDGQAWRGVFRDGVEAIDPPPGWLASRPRTRLATIRGARGYAVLPFPNGPTTTADQTRFEIVAASGDSCGTVTVPSPPDEPGVTHTPTALDVGQDGTLFQTETLVGTGLGMGIHGDFRWWPALLR